MKKSGRTTDLRRNANLRRFLLCLTMLLCIFILTGCASDQTRQKLDVYFFSCSDDADSILLQSDKGTVMIDTGLEEDCEKLLSQMEACRVSSIDLLILTHPDKDHIGGASGILEKFPVKKVIQTNCEKGSKLQEKLNRQLENENVIIPQDVIKESFGTLNLTIFPPEEISYKNSNNYSIGVLAEYEGKTFFFTGDAKSKRIKELLKQELPEINVLKVPHHGRDNEMSVELIETLKPEYAVITAKEPEELTKTALGKAGTSQYSTLDLTIHFCVQDGQILVDETEESSAAYLQQAG